MCISSAVLIKVVEGVQGKIMRQGLRAATKRPAHPSMYYFYSTLCKRKLSKLIPINIKTVVLL